MDNDQIARFVYIGLILTSVMGWAFYEFQSRLGYALRMAIIWGMIFIGTIAMYNLWQMNSFSAQTQQYGDEGIKVLRQKDGHFYLTVDINGSPIDFLIDTGASAVVLTAEDAQLVNIDLAELDYSSRAQTANGTTRTAPIRLETISLGPFTDRSMRAYVNEGDMDTSLLGMDYLRKYSMEFDNNILTLRRNN